MVCRLVRRLGHLVFLYRLKEVFDLTVASAAPTAGTVEIFIMGMTGNAVGACVMGVVTAAVVTVV